MSDGNGFSDMADYLGTLSNIKKEVSLNALEKAADFYLEKLKPNIPTSVLNKKHMNNQINVEVRNSEVVVIFDEEAFYWRFVENGTVNQKAQHFASGTYEQNKKQIERIMQEKIIRSWENGQ